MKGLNTIAAVVLSGLVAGCCGLLSNNNENTGSNAVKPREETRSASRNFSGTYRMESEDYEDLSLVITKEGKYYRLEWGAPASEPWFATGIEFEGYLCAYTQGEEGEDGVVGIYTKQGSKIAGLWFSGGEYVSDLSKGARALEPSDYDFSGAYDIHSGDVGDEEAYAYRLTIERNGDSYKARAVYEDGSNVSDEVVAVDRIIVMGFPQDGILVTKAFIRSGSKLKGKLIYAYPNYQTGIEEVSVGTEEGKRVVD